MFDLNRINQNCFALLAPALHNTDSHTRYGGCPLTMVSPHVMYRVDWCNLSVSWPFIFFESSQLCNVIFELPLEFKISNTLENRINVL